MAEKHLFAEEIFMFNAMEIEMLANKTNTGERKCLDRNRAKLP